MPALPELAAFSWSLLAGALAVTAIVLVQGVGVAESAPNDDGTRSDSNVDFVAQGVGNIGSGLPQGIPVGGSVGQTALNRAAGARTRWASIFSGLWMLLILVLFSGVVGEVAMPTLAALLIYAASGSLRFGQIATIWRTGLTSQIAIASTFVATLLLPVAAAVGLGVVLSLLLQLNQAALDLKEVELVPRDDGRLEECPAPQRLTSHSATLIDVYGSHRPGRLRQGARRRGRTPLRQWRRSGTHRAGSPHRDDRGGRPGDVTGAASHVLCDDTHDLITEDRGDGCSARGSDRTENAMENTPDRHSRGILPIPDVRPPGLTTYDAKDPATSFPPIEPLPPARRARRTCSWSSLDDVGFGASSAFGGPCNTPTAERLAAGGLRYNRFHTTALCAPTRQALLTGRNHHSVGHGQHHRDGDLGTRAVARCAPTPWRHWRMTLTLNGYSTAQFGKCHEVPVWQTSPMGPVRRLAVRRRRVRALLRVHRRREQPVGPRALRGHHTDRAAGDRRGGLPPHRRPHRPLRELDPPAEGADARQAVLRLLRARRHPRPAPRRRRVDRQVPGAVRPRLGRPARADLRRARRSSA